MFRTWQVGKIGRVWFWHSISGFAWYWQCKKSWVWMFKLHVSRSQRLISIKGLRLEQISRCSKCRESWKAKLCKTISHSRCYIFVNRRRISNCVFVYLSLYSCVCHWIIWNSHWNCGILERRFGGLVKALVTVSPFAAEIVCRYCFSSSPISHNHIQYLLCDDYFRCCIFAHVFVFVLADTVFPSPLFLIITFSICFGIGSSVCVQFT